MAFEEYERAATPEVEADTPECDPTCTPDSQPSDPTPDSQPSDPDCSGVQVEPQPFTANRMVNKKLQVNLRPPQRTRSHQTNPKYTFGTQTVPTYRTVSTQTDVFESAAQSTTSPYCSDDEDDEEPVHDDPDYTPSDNECR